MLQQSFQMKDLGLASYFLRVGISWHSRGYFLSQRKFSQEPIKLGRLYKISHSSSNTSHKTCWYFCLSHCDMPWHNTCSAHCDLNCFRSSEIALNGCQLHYCSIHFTPPLELLSHHLSSKGTSILWFWLMLVAKTHDAPILGSSLLMETQESTVSKSSSEAGYRAMLWNHLASQLLTDSGIQSLTPKLLFFDNESDGDLVKTWKIYLIKNMSDLFFY